MKIINNILFVVVCLVFLLSSVRGINGNPDISELRQEKRTNSGPFELSPERGRFALLYSLIEEKSIFFSEQVARFALPDLGLKNGKYVSLFAPGVSFIVIPGYLIGKLLGASQVGTFFVISIFAAINALLVKKIAYKLGSGEITSILSALAFLFATPAFSYAVNLYQHHISTFLILAGVHLVLKKENLKNDLLVWFLFGVGILVDYPNFFLMLPLVLVTLFRLFNVEIKKTVYKIRLNLWKILAVVGIILPILVFVNYNKEAYGSPYVLSGTVENIRDIDPNGVPIHFGGKTIDSDQEDSSYEARKPFDFFKSRNLINGFYILVFSPDRGMIAFAPLILFATLGLFELMRRKKLSAILLAIAGINLIIYSMWGDPWGGWAFGSRYLIPLYAAMSVFLGIALEKYRRDKLFMLMVMIAFIYSFSVNTLGALTTSANPPEVEAGSLSILSGHQEKITFERNLDYLLNSGTKSFVYNTYLSNYITPIQFFLMISLSLATISTISIIYITVFSYDSELEFTLKTQGVWRNLRMDISIRNRLITALRSIGLF